MVLRDALVNLPALRIGPVRQVLYKQIYFTGIKALPAIALLGALVGIIIITQVTDIVGFKPVLVGKILMWTVVRELGPLFAAIIVIARSGTAIASELASMTITGETRYLEAMGIGTARYMVAPRVAGVTVSVFVLAFVFQLAAVAGGVIPVSLYADVPFISSVLNIFAALSIMEIGVSLIKSAAFGLVISVISCYNGLKVFSSITQVPQATTSAVMQSLSLVFTMDGIISMLYFI
jgi:phospholipid/cholesterol/gamma-HCH transport system permease protein